MSKLFYLTMAIMSLGTVSANADEIMGPPAPMPTIEIIEFGSATSSANI